MTVPPDIITKEVENISFIYETLFPEFPLELHLIWGNADLPVPRILDLTETVGPDFAALGRIGMIKTGPEPRPGLSGKRILLPVPSPEQIAQRVHQAQSLIARRKLFGAIYTAAPLMAEQAKFQFEQWRFRRQAKVHSFVRLPFMPSLNSKRHAVPSFEDESNKPPAILIGMHWFDVGGAESLAIESVQWALEAGLRVFVMAELQGPERLLARLPSHPNLNILRTDRYLPRALVPSFICKLVTQENIILTHNHHCVPLYDALPQLKILHPNVHNIDSTHIVEYSDGGYPRVSGVWSNFIDTHHVISEDLKGFYNARFSVYGRKLRLGRLLDPSKRVSEIPPIRIQTGQKTCRVAFVGRMVHQKRPTVALKIMQKLASWGRRQGIKFRFDVVGTGPYRTRVERLIGQYRLGQNLHLHDAGIDVPALLRQSDILLLPSSNEGLALVCYEAIEAGCIPISTRVGGQAEICPEATLLDPEPGRTVRQSVKVIKRLLQERGFAEGVAKAQNDKMEALRADPTAQEVLGQIYRDAFVGYNQDLHSTAMAQQRS